jgi:hypothetical protein
MNPLSFIIGVVLCNKNTTYKQLKEIIDNGFKGTVFETIDDETFSKCLVKLLVDAHIEMSGDPIDPSTTVEEVAKMIITSDRTFRLMETHEQANGTATN